MGDNWLWFVLLEIALIVLALVSGIIGLMIWQQWPAPALWVVALFLGVSLILRGGNWISLGSSLRTLPRRR